MGSITTHILDTTRGRPATGVQIELFRLDPDRHLIKATRTNDQGRTDEPLLPSDAFRTGTYEIAYHTADYFRRGDSLLTEPPFLDVVVVRFGIAEDEPHHIPLLISPWSYAVYRGS